MHTHLDLTSRYLPFCEITCSHEYFRENTIPMLSVEPTKETKRRLKNLNIIFRQTPKGILLGGSERSTQNLIGLNEEEIKFSFIFRTEYRYFDNITAYSFRTNNEICFLENKTNQSILSKEEIISDDDKIPVRPPKFIYQLKEAVKNTSVYVKNPQNEILFERLVGDFPKQRFTINLNGEDSGKYSLFIGEKEIFSFYLLTDSLRGGIGIVELDLKKLITKNKIEKKQYKFQFGARSAIWRYYFRSRNPETVYKNHKIELYKKNGRIYKFTVPKEVTIYDGKEATVIESKDQLKLKEIPLIRFALKAQKTNNRQGISIQLPTPIYKNIKYDKELGHLVAEIFLNI